MKATIPLQHQHQLQQQQRQTQVLGFASLCDVFLESQITAGFFPPPTESDESYNPAIHGVYDPTASYAQETSQTIGVINGTITPATPLTDGEQPKDLQKCKDCGRRYPAKDFLY